MTEHRTTIKTIDGRTVPFAWDDYGRSFTTKLVIDGVTYFSVVSYDKTADERVAADHEVIKSAGCDPSTIDFENIHE